MVKAHRERAEAKWRVTTYGEAPYNPFFELRTNAALTLGELSTYSGIDRRALQRSEDGLYTNPLPALLDYWEVKGHNPHELMNEYEDFQVGTRVRHERYFGPLNFPVNGPTHPMRYFRANRPHPVDLNPAPVGLIDACRALCVPLDTVQYWEKKYSQQQSIPKVILASLNQMGYGLGELRGLKERYGYWREAKLNSQFNLEPAND